MEVAPESPHVSAKSHQTCATAESAKKNPKTGRNANAGERNRASKQEARRTSGARRGGLAGDALGGVDAVRVALERLFRGHVVDVARERADLPLGGADLPQHPQRRGLAELREPAARRGFRGLPQPALELRERRLHRRRQRRPRRAGGRLHRGKGLGFRVAWIR